MNITRVFAFALSLAAMGVQAQSGGPTFNQLDSDKDGAISVEEATMHSALVEKFDQLDSDGDGKLSRSEFAAFEQSHP